MDRETAQRILTECISAYRRTSHAELAARLSASSDLDVIEGVAIDGTKYTIEVNLLWDDKRLQHIRVMADLSSGRSFTPDAADCFIMVSDGSFIGE